MEEFNTIDAIGGLFSRVNCVGQYNCFFAGYVDTTSSAGLFGGALGGLAGGIVAGMNKKCDGYLINQTERGIGLIPLNSKGFSNNLAKMKADINSFIFIDQGNIKSVTIKKANLISLVTKKVVINLADGSKYNLLVNNKEKNLPYHETNFNNFINGYKM